MCTGSMRKNVSYRCCASRRSPFDSSTVPWKSTTRGESGKRVDRRDKHRSASSYLPSSAAARPTCSRNAQWSSPSADSSLFSKIHSP